MDTYEQTREKIHRLLVEGDEAGAEAILDGFADLEPDELGRSWGLDPYMGSHFLSNLYNIIGHKYNRNGIEAVWRNDRDAMLTAAREAERCHEKAWDLYDMGAEDVMYLPYINPLNKNIVFTFWGLGSAKYVLSKHEESRKFLLLCVRLSLEDEQVAVWQSDASHYLRLLDAKPVQLALRVASVMPSILNPHLIQITGGLLEWGAYTKPLQTDYFVYVSSEDMDWLTAQGYRNSFALEGRTLVLKSDATGDLSRPCRITEVH
jgi:hypothetical protein